MMEKRVEMLVELMKLLELMRRSGGRTSGSLAGVVVAGGAGGGAVVTKGEEVRVLVKRRKREMK